MIYGTGVPHVGAGFLTMGTTGSLGGAGGGFTAGRRIISSPERSRAERGDIPSEARTPLVRIALLSVRGIIGSWGEHTGSVLDRRTVSDMAAVRLRVGILPTGLGG
jgi:hypothetical protein